MPGVSHLELLVEEPSMEAFLQALLARMLPADRSFTVHPFQGKDDLLAKLEARLRGYAAWLPNDSRIIVVVDRDDEDCRLLKQRLEVAAVSAGLRSRSRAPRGWQVANRIAIEELEAWYFGDWDAVRTAYPRVDPNTPRQRGFRDSDAIVGTWEAFERVMRRRGYFQAGLTKVEAARRIAAHVDPARTSSRSFRTFWHAVAEALELQPEG